MNGLLGPARSVAIAGLIAVLILIRAENAQSQTQGEVLAERMPQLSAAQDPLGAWQELAASVPTGFAVRRIAFADHGTWMFFSPLGKDDLWARFAGLRNGELTVDDVERRENFSCAAEAVSPETVELALRQLVRKPIWQQHHSRMHALILECDEPQLYWSLLTVPTEGFKAGQSVPMFRSAFRLVLEADERP